jgi:putative tricarboxylic transport membrane protein
MVRGSHNRSDLIGGAVWIALGLAIVVACWRMDRFTQMGATLYTMPGLVPAIVGAVLALLGAALMLRAWRQQASGDRSETQRPLLNARVVRFGAVCLAYALGLVGRVPFWLGTALFVTAAIAIFAPADQPPARRFGLALLIGAITSIAIATVFERVFLVRLP